jgi:Flp pilus assembly protein TadG
MQTRHRPYRRLSRRERTKGAELIEFSFTFIPWMAMIIFICNTAWAVYSQATLQQAVRLAVRTGITLTATQLTAASIPGNSLSTAVKGLVQANANGILNGSNGGYIHVRYFAKDNSGNVTEVTGAGSNQSPNIMQVSVEGYPLSPLFSRIYTLRGSVDHDPMNIYVYSADLIEPSNDPPTP